MANKSSINAIQSKHDDWGRDLTNNLPYSGESVQAWIKEQLDGKAGDFYYDASNNRFLVFADEENRELYLSDPIEYASFLIGAFDAPFNYTATVTLVDTQSINYIKAGSTGNYIKATFDVLNKQGASIGENVNVTISFRNGSAVSRVIRSVAYGSLLSLNIDEYLSVGTNSITIAAVGQDTLAATSIGLTYYCINLQLNDTFDISQNISPNGNLDIAFNITGSGIKRLEWFIDQVQVPYDPQNDDVTASEASRTKTIPLSSYNLSNGRHNLQYRAYIEAGDGTLFYSDILYRDFIVNNGYLQDYLTVVAFEYPYSASYGTNGIIDPFTEPIPMYGATQYETKEIQYAVNSPFGESTMTITCGNSVSTYSASNRNVYTYELKSFDSGVSYLSFVFGTDILEFNVHFAETRYEDLETITNGLVFVFDKNDSTNASSNRDSWSYGSYTAEMTGFSWTDRSGWTKDGLLIPAGASFVTDFAPLAGNPVISGYTIEMELETQRVLDDSAVICDLRTAGTGLLVTASEASITSRGGVSVSTKYKSGVPLRVSFVINPPTATRNKNLLFIYIDGILAGAMNYPSSDSFTSSALLQFHGSANASVLLKQVRCYSRALSDTEILNNYILYRPTTDELIATYDRNDILNSNSQPSYEKLAAYTPIIIVTGDVEKLMNFDRSNKGTYVKMDKIEIINNQDPTRNLTILNASMRCQGTSSMDYPRKNFRFYLKKDSADTTVDSYTTKVFDYQGVELLGGNRKYAFKEGAQEVACWCLKADYAESSSTHNTGVARLWNTVMKNAVINDIDSRHYVLNSYPNSKTPCRTLAQHAAQANNFENDVRTTVDGMPIVLFYHKNESDALICLGKYNWNNDKSTESVYGFVDIPGFDNSHVECWEVVNGDYPINQFVDISNWSLGANNGGWQDSFEARYPDDSGKPSEATRAEGALKSICTWINSTKGAATLSNNEIVVGNYTLMNKFSSEKWEHLDVYKLAAYYVYLMRFGGVDQTVKNAMFTTEDGVHWFYINYDNDTILGVRNDGLLKFDYTIDRQSKDPDNINAYCYAGHDSVLWNNLEADSEFMEIVQVVDRALFDAGLTYTNVINMFNEEQSGKWSERLHNYDYTFKYLDVWLDDQNMQLEKLQGPRRTHREWWLSNRFAIFDARNRSGQYLKSYVSIKPSTDGPASSGDIVYVTPKMEEQLFGWRLGTNGAIHTALGNMGVIGFDLYDAGISYYIGGSLFFFNAVYMQKIDFSKISSHIQELSFGDVNSDVFPSYLEEIVVSDTNSVINTAMSGVSNLGNVKYLRNFQMCNCTAVANVNLSSNIYLENIDLRGCSTLTSVDFPTAAPITSIQLPNSMQSLQIKDLTELTTLAIESNAPALVNINASNCKPFNDNITWIKTWITGKTDEFLANCTVRIDGVDWHNIEVNDLLLLGKIGNLTVKGKIQANFAADPSEQVAALQAIYGEHCLDSTNDLWIYGNELYHDLVGPSTIIEGQVAQYTLIVIGASGTTRYEVRNNSRPGVRINATTGQVTTTLNNVANSTMRIYAYFTPSDTASQDYITEYKQVTILKETYPAASDITISGESNYLDSSNKSYSAVVANSESFTGMNHLSHYWSVTGDLADYYYIASQPSDSLSCVVACSDSNYVICNGTIKLSFMNSLGTIVTEKEFAVTAQSGNVAISRLTNAPAMNAFWNAYGTNGTREAGRIANANYVTKSEASTFTNDELCNGTSGNSIFQGTGMTHFEEIKWFDGLTKLPSYIFQGLTNLKGTFELPSSIKTFYLYAFENDVSGINVSGSGVTNVYQHSSTGGSRILQGTFSFPNCTSWAGSYQRFGNNTVIDIPKCTSFSDIFYQQSSSHKVTIRVGTLDITYNGVAWASNFVKLIIPTTCNIPSGNIWIANTGSWNTDKTNPLYSITLDEGVDKFQVIDGVLYNAATGKALRSIYGLGTITLPSTCTSIGNYCFYGSNVLDMTVPASVTSTGVQCWGRCQRMNKLTFLGTTPPSFTSYPFWTTGNMKTVGPIGGGYNLEYAWTTTFPGSIGMNSGFQQVTLPSTITSIGNSAFNQATGLKQITSYAETAPTLGSSVFTSNTGASPKMIYVPTNSTGYDSGDWLTQAVNTAGFTISKTL